MFLPRALWPSPDPNYPHNWGGERGTTVPATLSEWGQAAARVIQRQRRGKFMYYIHYCSCAGWNMDGMPRRNKNVIATFPIPPVRPWGTIRGHHRWARWNIFHVEFQKRIGIQGEQQSADAVYTSGIGNNKFDSLTSSAFECDMQEILVSCNISYFFRWEICAAKIDLGGTEMKRGRSNSDYFQRIQNMNFNFQNGPVSLFMLYPKLVCGVTPVVKINKKKHICVWVSPASGVS